MLLTLSSKHPQTIGPYDVLEAVAGGASGQVYKGRNPATGDLVAIKLASKETASKPLLRKRFEQEFHVASSLEHPNLVRALELGEHDGTPFIVMELVDGPSLGDRIERDGKLSEDQAVRIILQVAEGLGAGHKQRIIHRDVKPDNILLASDGSAKLIDLGLRKDLEGADGLTRTSSGLGTPNFMAPEQFSDAKHADARCDIYSLGATLYMAVTGQLPFAARLAYEIWQKKIKGDLPAVRKLVPGLSPALERAIQRAVHVEPGHRYASCQDFIKDLNAVAKRRGRSSVVRRLPSGAAAPVKEGKGDKRATVRFSSKQGGFCNALNGPSKQHWPAKVQDVSAGGIALILGRRFEPRTTLWVDLLGTGDASDRYFLVRVVRVEARPGKKWLVGCVFARPLTDEEVEALR